MPQRSPSQPVLLPAGAPPSRHAQAGQAGTEEEEGGGLFAFAGLYTPAEDETQAPPTCTILTTVPNELAAAIHDRMPVILERAEEARWLDPALRTPDQVLPCLHPLPAARMEAYPGSLLVSSPRNQGPQLVARRPA